MVYRLTYKKWSESQRNFVLVEEDVTADNFEVVDGNLVFHITTPDGRYPISFMAIPMTAWSLVIPKPEDEPRIAL